MTLIKKTIIAAMIAVVANSASATIITLEEAEAKRIQIMNSDRSLKEKLSELRTLNQVLDENQKIQQKLLGESESKPLEPVKNEIPKTVVKYDVPKGWELNTVFVSEIFGIGNDITAEIFVNGEALPPIDVVLAHERKEKFGAYIIASYTPTTITFKDTETQKQFTRRVISAEQIAKKIEHNNKLNQQYQEKYAMGTLEARLENFVDTNRSPVDVSYQTQASTPLVFDTMQGQ